MYGVQFLTKKPRGGLIEGPGTGTSDSIKKEVQIGSFIMPADSTAKLGLNAEVAKAHKANQPESLPGFGVPSYSKKVPVNLSNGEFELTPEQVHAVGVQTLNQVKDATHTPTELPRLGVLKRSNNVSKELFFANGGLVGAPEELPRLGVSRWTPEQRTQKQAQLASQTQALRDARMGNQAHPLKQPTDAQPSAPQTSTSAKTPAPANHPRLGVPGWNKTGIGKGAAGGEIAMQTGAGGAPDFTNAPSALADAQDMPAGGVGRIGDGVGGGLSVGAPGDSQLALERFGRANEIRAEAIAARPREAGDTGRVAVIEDSSRTPTYKDRARAAIDSQRAQSDAMRARARQGEAQTNQGIALDQQRMQTEQLNQQQIQQQIQGGKYDLQNHIHLAELGDRLVGASPEQRAGIEREYLLRSNPGAYVEQQAGASTRQVELEKKQLERDLLRMELEQNAGGTVKLTEQQSKDLGYYTRGNEANAQLAQQGDALTGRATGERGQLRGLSDAIIRGTAWVGDSSLANSLVSTERQRAEQSGREVLSAILRKDTGAAITNQEMDIYGKMYLPLPGDSDEVLNQKAEARTRALASIRSGLGTAERKASPVHEGQRTTSSALPSIRNDQDYAALPSGSTYVAPDGTTRRKP